MTEPLHPLHVAGLLVSAAPGQLRDVVRHLSAAPGLQVHARDDTTGRIVVTIETASIDEQEAQFAWVRTLCGVRAVDLVCHYFEP
jgi:nitrate reductase NapAB chaperone NapD